MKNDDLLEYVMIGVVVAGAIGSWIYYGYLTWGM